MTRRTLGLLITLTLAILVAPLTATAQQTKKTASIGYLTPVFDRNPVEEAFEQALQELGRSRGRNIQIESRYSGGRQDTIAALMAELVGLRLDVIVAWGLGFGLAAKQATSQILVVFLDVR
jgi:putative tryptophan/tyrosine transport system substrate-binding protein